MIPIRLVRGAFNTVVVYDREDCSLNYQALPYASVGCGKNILNKIVPKGKGGEFRKQKS